MIFFIKKIGLACYAAGRIDQLRNIKSYIGLTMPESINDFIDKEIFYFTDI